MDGSAPDPTMSAESWLETNIMGFSAAATREAEEMSTCTKKPVVWAMVEDHTTKQPRPNLQASYFVVSLTAPLLVGHAMPAHFYVRRWQVC